MRNHAPSIAAAVLAVLLTGGLYVRAQETVKVQPPKPDLENSPTTDEDYRKFDKTLAFLRKRNADAYAIKSAKGIDEAGYVNIGAIEQWVTIRGQDRGNPVLLILHGGPGDPTNPWTFAMFADWEKYFTVVQWDQRGAGRTFTASGPSVGPTMTIDRMVEDGIEIAEYLRMHLAKEKIIIVAHSFGSVLGLQMIRKRPDLFFSYVGTGQVSDYPDRNYTATYEALLRKAQSIGNQEAIDELTATGTGAGYRLQWRWANRFEGADQFIMSTLGLSLVAPGNSVRYMVNHEEGMMLSGERLVPQTKSVTQKVLGYEFSIPIFFFQGSEDFTTSTVLAEEYLKLIKAPHKEFVRIKGGHFAMFMNSGEFLQELVNRVRPPAER